MVSSMGDMIVKMMLCSSITMIWPIEFGKITSLSKMLDPMRKTDTQMIYISIFIIFIGYNNSIMLF